MQTISRRLRLCAALALSGSLAAGVHAKDLIEGIEPGPTVQSDRERALEADPDAGIEHAVILVEEYERDEDLGVDMRMRYHLRAKILSNEGRDLADVEIPISDGGKLVEWWGRTIQPDGQVLELEESELERQTVVRSLGVEVEAVKAALPGVVAGSVIDYGYVVRENGWVPFDRVPLQREYQTEHFRYAWRPFSGASAAFYLGRAEGLDLSHNVKRQVIVVEGSNLPPARTEELMPPLDEVRGMLYLYYLAGGDYEDFWDDMSRRITGSINRATKKSSVRKALEEIAPAPDGTLDAKLIALYDWIGRNITREGLRSFEEARTDDDEGKERRDAVRQLMETRRGSVYEIDVAFIALARGLGARAELVFSPDRTENYWNMDVKSIRQFGGTLVAVGPPGAGPEKMTVIDPGCGLPFGHVPWWLAGVRGMMVDGKKSRRIDIPLKGPDGSVAVARAVLEFVDDNEVITTEWSRSATGQEGVSRIRGIRRLAPSDREKRGEEMCSTDDEADVLLAEMSEADVLTDRFDLRCEVEEFTDLDERIGSYHQGFLGPWIQGLPDLPDAERHHPVVLRYPRYEETLVVLQSPDGFVNGEAPRNVDLETEFGRYTLDFANKDSGFEVTRRLAVVLPGIPRQSYAGFREFLEAIRAHDRSSVVFVREGTPR